MTWDEIVVVDWSGGNDRGPRPTRDAIWIGAVGPGGAEPAVYCRNRLVAEAWLMERTEAALAAGRRVLYGFDFAFGYPEGATRQITGQDDPLQFWRWLAERIEDAPGANNRFDIAAEMNGCFPGIGPFWGNASRREVPGLPRRGRDRTYRWPEPRRAAERAAPGAFEVWQLAYAGAVGSQVLMGLPVLWRLRAAFPGRVAAWPFEAPDQPIALVEIWPSLVARAIRDDPIRDRAQVTGLAAGLAALRGPRLRAMLDVPVSVEGWILGLGHGAELAAAVATAE